MTTYDTIIRGGRIVDGTGYPAFRGGIGITGGRSAALGNLARAAARRGGGAARTIVPPSHG